MTLPQIKAMQLPMAKDCAVFMWATMPMLPEALDVLRAWDLGYKTVAFTWVKLRKQWLKELLVIAKEWQTRYQTPHDSTFIPSRLGKLFHFGLGYYTRANVELCLLATRGKITRINAAIPQLVVAPVGEHSQKPAIVRERIVGLMGDRPRLEMFAREAAEGWSRWGLEAPEGEGRLDDGF